MLPKPAPSVRVAVDGLASQLRVTLLPRLFAEYLHLVSARAGAGTAARRCLCGELAAAGIPRQRPNDDEGGRAELGGARGAGRGQDGQQGMAPPAAACGHCERVSGEYVECVA